MAARCANAPLPPPGELLRLPLPLPGVMRAEPAFRCFGRPSLGRRALQALACFLLGSWVWFLAEDRDQMCPLLDVGVLRGRRDWQLFSPHPPGALFRLSGAPVAEPGCGGEVPGGLRSRLERQPPARCSRQRVIPPQGDTLEGGRRPRLPNGVRQFLRVGWALAADQSPRKRRLRALAGGLRRGGARQLLGRGLGLGEGGRGLSSELGGGPRPRRSRLNSAGRGRSPALGPGGSPQPWRAGAPRRAWRRRVCGEEGLRPGTPPAQGPAGGRQPRLASPSSGAGGAPLGSALWAQRDPSCTLMAQAAWVGPGQSQRAWAGNQRASEELRTRAGTTTSARLPSVSCRAAWGARTRTSAPRRSSRAVPGSRTTTTICILCVLGVRGPCGRKALSSPAPRGPPRGLLGRELPAASPRPLPEGNSAWPPPPTPQAVEVLLGLSASWRVICGAWLGAWSRGSSGPLASLRSPAHSPGLLPGPALEPGRELLALRLALPLRREQRVRGECSAPAGRS